MMSVSLFVGLLVSQSHRLHQITLGLSRHEMESCKHVGRRIDLGENTYDHNVIMLVLITVITIFISKCQTCDCICLSSFVTRLYLCRQKLL